MSLTTPIVSVWAIDDTRAVSLTVSTRPPRGGRENTLRLLGARKHADGNERQRVRTRAQNT
jgi:hypothetical protein